MDTVAMEARYLAASRRAYRAWQGSQPQYVIPGLWDALEAAPLSATVSAVRAGGSFERELTAGVGVEGEVSTPAVSIALNAGGEPRHDLPSQSGRACEMRDGSRLSCPASGVSPPPVPSPPLPTSRGTAASSAQGNRDRPQKGA